jgi:hypothetical protein
LFWHSFVPKCLFKQNLMPWLDLISLPICLVISGWAPAGSHVIKLSRQIPLLPRFQLETLMEDLAFVYFEAYRRDSSRKQTVNLAVEARHHTFKGKNELFYYKARTSLCKCSTILWISCKTMRFHLFCT